MPKSKKSDTNNKSPWALYSLTVVISALALLVIFALIDRTIFGIKQSTDASYGFSQIQIDLQNGCGVPGVAKTIENFLKDEGFDVRNVQNAADFSFRQSVIINYGGKISNANTIAKALGIPAQNIINKADEQGLWDFTVIIGHDYNELTPFKNKELKGQ